ncbi:MAG TPA: dihydrofolate reductase family protein [Bryobacteraceae bacterium]|nr:dihydrofolate reductase family protein [Bryobacteraceae bacterium]
MEPVRTLWTSERNGPPLLPERLRNLYGGDLRFPNGPRDRPYVMANFVSTLDGVVSFSLPGQAGGGAISGSNEGDRFIMGLLRASADAVLVASGTVAAASQDHLWTAEFVYPDESAAYREYRRSVLKKPGHPLLAIVSGSGKVALDRAVFHTPGIKVLILTSMVGKAELDSAGAGKLASTEVRVCAATEGRIPPAAVLNILKEEFGVSLILHEGGPIFFAEFLVNEFIDELFLTLAPQIAGRTEGRRRPSLVSRVEFTPAQAPWLKLAAVKGAGDFLYLRYRARETA